MGKWSTVQLGISLRRCNFALRGLPRGGCWLFTVIFAAVWGSPGAARGVGVLEFLSPAHLGFCVGIGPGARRPGWDGILMSVFSTSLAVLAAGEWGMEAADMGKPTWQNLHHRQELGIFCPRPSLVNGHVRGVCSALSGSPTALYRCTMERH